MAARFWVGGTGSWDATAGTKWSTTSGGAGGAAVPTSADDVTFDSGSSGAGYTVTVSATANCANLTIGQPAAGNLTFAGSAAINVAGNFAVMSSSVVYTHTGTITMTATSGTKTITTNGETITSGFNMNGTGGTFQLADNFSSTNINGTFTRTAGTFDPNGKTVTMSSTLMQPSGFSGANSFFNLTINGAVGKVSQLSLANALTCTGTISLNGNSVTDRLHVQANGSIASVTITAATVSASNADFSNIVGAGAGSWNLSAISGNSGDCGGNSGITFTTAADQHWVSSTGGTWSTAAKWTSRVPLPQDNVFFDVAFGTSQTVTMDMPRAGKNIDFTGATWTTALTATASTSITIFGSLTLISGLTSGSGSTILMSGPGTKNIDTKGVTINSPLELSCFSTGATYTLKGNLTLGTTRTLRTYNSNTGTVTLSAVDGANNWVISAGAINNQSGTLTLGSATHLLNNTGTVFTGSGTITAFTGILKVVNTSNSAVTFAGGGKTYNQVWFSRAASTGSITISGNNTFGELKDDGTAGHSILFTAASTQTITTWNVNGTAGNLIIINSTTTATHNLVKAGGGQVSANYLNIQHSVATPSTFTWYANTTSTNNQGVATAGSGWFFTAPVPPPVGGPSKMLLMGV